MRQLEIRSKNYDVDDQGYLLEPDQWDEDFAEGIAAEDDLVTGGLTDGHWRVIHFIRIRLEETGHCPLIFEACRSLQLTLKQMQRLFPSGYHRGACKVAGLAYGDRPKNFFGEEPPSVAAAHAKRAEKSYRVNAFGFLMDPAEWDERFAVHKAQELGMAGGLDERHWKLLRFMRDRFSERGEVPTVYEACEAMGLELDELEQLFPTGYHRGVVKISGLRVI